MARMLITFDGRTESGGAPIIYHNPRLADPLNPWALELGKISRKRGKTEADHMEMARIEFLGGLYHDGLPSPDNISSGKMGPYFPTWNVIRCIQGAGKQHKLGAAILRGMTPVAMETPLEYEGLRDPIAMFKAGTFMYRKDVGIGAARTMRTRCIITDWTLNTEVEIDLRILDPEKINQLAQEAGRYQAMGDYRPVYGRFLGSARLLNAAEIAKAA